MAKKRTNDAATSPPSFRPRRTVEPSADAAEERVVVRAYVPKSLYKDISLYALERDCSVSDLIYTILRKAIPSLKVVTVPESRPTIAVAEHQNKVAPAGAITEDELACTLGNEPPAAKAA